MKEYTIGVAVAGGNAAAGNNRVIVSPLATQKVRAYKLLLKNRHNATNIVSIHWQGVAALVPIQLDPNVGIQEIPLPEGFHVEGSAGLDLQIDVTAGSVDFCLFYHFIDA